MGRGSAKADRRSRENWGVKMLVGSGARAAAGALLGLVVVVATTLAGHAANKKPRAHIFDDLVTPAMMDARVQSTAPPPVANGARFFSINSVLARADGKAPPDQQVRLASATPTDVVSDAPDAGMPQSSLGTNEPFGLFTFRAPQGVLWRKWRTLKSDIGAELEQVSDCKSDRSTCSEAANRFVLMLEETRQRSGRARIETANRLINGAIRYQSDLAQHGVVDLWSAPLASLATGRGDCEDYAIAKYVLLREAGIPEQDLRILLVRDRSVREDHAVLAVREENAWLVLDNRRSFAANDSEFDYFTPLYVLDAGGVSLFAKPYLSQQLEKDGQAMAPAADGLPSAGQPYASEFDSAELPAVAGGAGSNLPLLM
jgi:predicted transglutaminase-like cysteine proteinase